MTPLKKLLTAAVIVATSLVPVALDSPAQDAGLTKPGYELIAQSTLSGTVTLTGEVPEEKRIDLSADPVCEQQRPHATYEAFVVKQGRVANVLVYITSETLLENYSFLPPASPVVVERKQCRFEPRVLGVQVGQPLEVINRDATHHNMHPIPSETMNGM